METNQSSSTELPKVENQRALVATPISSREVNKTKIEFNDAIWITNIPLVLKVGQNVHVWFEGGATSYPAQGKASNVMVSEIQKLDKAVITQDAVIRKVLLNKDISSINVLAIKKVSYDENSVVWTIRYKDAIISDGLLEEHSMQVSDTGTILK